MLHRAKAYAGFTILFMARWCVFLGLLVVLASCKSISTNSGLRDQGGKAPVTVKASSIPNVDDGWLSSRWDHGFFAPYSPVYAPGAPDDLKLLILAFISADSNGDLEPTWMGLELDNLTWNNGAVAALEEIIRLRQNGGDAMISFGGAGNMSLARAHLKQGKGAQVLAANYARVLDYFKVGIIDFDIEGGELKDLDAIRLHSAALAMLQKERPRLRVWHTLPVFPQGLTAPGLAVIRELLSQNLNLAGVNIMAMDYTDLQAPPGKKSMGAYAIDAAESTYGQLLPLFKSHQRTFGWKNLGITPMIGQNDVRSEIFSLDDAKLLTKFARDRGLGMLSMWAVNRDRPGRSIYNSTGLALPANSFSKAFSEFKP